MSSVWNWIWNNDGRVDSRTKQILSYSLEELDELDRKIKQELALLTEDVPTKRVFNPAPKKKRHGLKLIKPMNKKNTTKSVNIGGMVYDPDRKIWLGNDKDLAKFRQAPPLITSLSPQPKSLTNSGMKFDPEQGRWVGNEDVLAIFEDDKESEVITSTSDFKVGSEFSLSESTIKTFYDCEESFKRTLGGWASNTTQDNGGRSHLYLIRNMSISKIINQVKQGYSTVPVSTKSNSATSINLDTSSSTSAPRSNDANVSKSVSGDTNVSNVPPPTKHSQLLSKYQEKSDDWNDMEDISSKVSSKTVSEEKEDKKEASSVVVELGEEEEEESWDDIEVPNGTLKLHINSTTDNKEDLLSKYQDEEEDEEDWEEVSVPTKYHHSENTKVAAISKSSLNEDDEDWSGLEIPNKLQLKVPISPIEYVEEPIKEEDTTDNMEDEDWDDVVIPDNFASKLQSKKPSTTIQSF